MHTSDEVCETRTHYWAYRQYGSHWTRQGAKCFPLFENAPGLRTRTKILRHRSAARATPRNARRSRNTATETHTF